jgi:DNA-binding PadR family transcriptional regulator
MSTIALHDRRCARAGLRRMGREHRGRRRFGPEFGPRAGHFFGSGRKAGRGDIRAAILRLLAERPMHGYQIIREVAERSEDVWRPSPGSVYPTLQQLEDEDLVSQVQSETGKRVFELTDAGRAAAEQAPPAPWEEAAREADDDLVALRDLVFQVVAAARQVAHAGAPAQLERAREILRDTRRRLYGVLAEDDPAQ